LVTDPADETVGVVVYFDVVPIRAALDALGLSAANWTCML
jgi:hypothetical protein